MRVVILAAGRGTRLGKPYPKTLTTLKDGKSILSHQIEGICQYVDIGDILVVVGYKKGLIMEVFPDLSHLDNDRYDETNTSQSLLIALNHISDEDILWLNGDIVFDHRVIGRLLDYGKSCMAVNTAQVGDEEVKYRTNEMGHVIEISKEVGSPQGESVGIHNIPAKEVPILIKYPAFPFINISEGPVGQFVDITNFFKLKASSSTFGKPSNLEVRTNKSVAFIYLYGFF